MLFSFCDRWMLGTMTLVICLLITEGKKTHRKHSIHPSSEDKESQTTFITIRIPARVATRNQDCIYEGIVRHHGDAWSPGPCIPECRCKHGHVQCSKLECPDLNCDKPIKRKWKCCPECQPGTDNGTSCGVWTKEGNANGGCCVFPFHYNDVMYYTCTYQDHDKPWCSITMNFDRDGVWGECIDKGVSKKSLKYKHHKKKQHKLQDKQDNTDALVSNIANSVSNSLTPDGNASGNIPTARPVIPTGNVSSSPPSNAAPSESNGVLTTRNHSAVAPSNATSVHLQPSPASLQQQPSNASMAAASNESGSQSGSPAIAPSTVAPSMSQSSGTPIPGGGQHGEAAAASPSVAASPQPVPQPVPHPQHRQPLFPGQEGGIPTPSMRLTSQWPTPTPPLAASGTPLLPQTIRQPTQSASPPSTWGQNSAFPYPAEPGTTQGHPWPETQTTLGPEQTQAVGQAVHELNMHEYGANYNVSTSEFWFGNSNAALNRTADYASQAGAETQTANQNVTTTNQTTTAAGNETTGNQTTGIAGNEATGNETTEIADSETTGNQTATSVGNETTGNQTTGSAVSETTGNQTTGNVWNETTGNQSVLVSYGITGNEITGNQTTGNAGNEANGNQTLGSNGNETLGNQSSGSAGNETSPAGNQTVVSQNGTARDWYIGGNQGSLGYQAPVSPYEYQSQTQDQYMEQPSTRESDSTAYNPVAYNGYDEYPAYQQYSQPSYYYSNDQYQKNPDLGSYYTG